MMLASWSAYVKDRLGSDNLLGTIFSHDSQPTQVDLRYMIQAHTVQHAEIGDLEVSASEDAQA